MKRKHSKIDKLPADIKEAVEQMILGDYTYRDVCDFVRDDKVIGEDVRLDNGTSDIDTLDAFEYSFERYIPRLIRRD